MRENPAANKFNVGETVYIRIPPHDEAYYNNALEELSDDDKSGCYFNDYMVEEAHKHNPHIITHVEYSHDRGCYYYELQDWTFYIWLEGWLEPLEEIKIDIDNATLATLLANS